MNNLKRLGGIWLTLNFLVIVGCDKQTESFEKPNIIVILADDMGYSDIGCFGGEISTPNIDNLAANGVRFTQFYNAARCCPTRASLMTGIYPHECGIGDMTHNTAGPGYLGYLNDSCTTIPEVLSKAGYSTGIAGKWHAGTLKPSWPENRGFQKSYCIHNWVDSYFKVLKTCEVYENGKVFIPETADPGDYDPQPGNKEWYTTDVFARKAMEHIDQAIDEGKPFFEYLAFNAPHWPLEAHDDVIRKYLDKYNDGYEVLREEKYKKMKQMGVIPAYWELPEQNTPEWGQLSDSAKINTCFRRAIYAAQVEILDENVGKLVGHLRGKGVLHNTLIFFLSDNGCSPEPEGTDFGYQWPNNTRLNYTGWRKNSGRTSASQGRVWAITSNTPFRKYKRFTYEGGISTPLIVHWPDGITNPGRASSHVGHLFDIMATCIDLSGSEYPKTRNDVPVIPARGISLKNVLKEKENKDHGFLFWEHEGHGAVRKGKWKLVSDKSLDESFWELYDLENDRTETKNLRDEQPEVFKELKTLWEQTAYSIKAWPVPPKDSIKRNPIEYQY